MMVSPNQSKAFHVYIDASDMALRGALLQEGILGYLQPMYYTRKTLTKAQNNHSKTQREALIVLLKLQNLGQ